MYQTIAQATFANNLVDATCAIDELEALARDAIYNTTDKLETRNRRLVGSPILNQLQAG
jgi:hypothetical protein